MKLRKSILFLLGFLVVILAVGCGGFTEDVQRDVTTASVSETTQETSTAIPTPTAKVTATPAPTTDIGQAIQAGNEPIPTMPEQEAAVDSMETRRQEVIAYEKERDGYSPSEQGSRGMFILVERVPVRFAMINICSRNLVGVKFVEHP